MGASVPGPAPGADGEAMAPWTSPTGVRGPLDSEDARARPAAPITPTTAMNRTRRPNPPRCSRSESGRGRLASGEGGEGEALLGQQNTMRDAVLAGLSLDVFNRHADKVGMANIAQLVNCLQSLFLAHEDKFCVTPTGHVFAMYADHQKGQSLKTLVSAPSVRYPRGSGQGSIAGISCSASLQGKRLVITATNTELRQAREVTIALAGAAASSAKATVLAAADAHAHNTLSESNVVAPKAGAVTLKGSSIHCVLPAASVNKLVVDLV